VYNYVRKNDEIEKETINASTIAIATTRYFLSHLHRSSGLPGPKKLIRPNLAISSFKKGQILKNEEMPNFAQKFVEIKRFNVRISKILLTFALIFPKLALQYSILFNIKKMANVPNHFTSGIQS